MAEHWLGIGWALAEHRLGIGWALAEHRLDIGSALAGVCKVHGMAIASDFESTTAWFDVLPCKYKSTNRVKSKVCSSL